ASSVAAEAALSPHSSVAKTARNDTVPYCDSAPIDATAVGAPSTARTGTRVVGVVIRGRRRRTVATAATTDSPVAITNGVRQPWSAPTAASTAARARPAENATP